MLNSWTQEDNQWKAIEHMTSSKYHFFRGVYITRATCISMDSLAV